MGEDIWELGTDHRWHFPWRSPRAYWYLGWALWCEYRPDQVARGGRGGSAS
jgi:hypothetical protein